MAVGAWSLEAVGDGGKSGPNCQAQNGRRLFLNQGGSPVHFGGKFIIKVDAAFHDISLHPKGDVCKPASVRDWT